MCELTKDAYDADVRQDEGEEEEPQEPIIWFRISPEAESSNGRGEEDRGKVHEARYRTSRLGKRCLVYYSKSEKMWGTVSLSVATIVYANMSIDELPFISIIDLDRMERSMS